MILNKLFLIWSLMLRLCRLRRGNFTGGLQNSDFYFLDFFVFGDSLNAEGQRSLFKQEEQFGDLGKQTVWPKPTSIKLTSDHSSRGNQLSSSFLVCSGSFVGFDTQFSRFAILWTWTSTYKKTSFQIQSIFTYEELTPIPVTILNAEFIQIWA